MEQRLLEKLEEFGLAEKEAKVYMASLELGSTTAEKLSQQAGVNRSTTYVQIEELIRMGLMSTHEVGKKTLYFGESPDNLKRLYEKKQEQLKQKFTVLETFLPELARLHDSVGERPVVRFFQGKEGLTTVRNEVLKLKNTNIYLAFSFDYLWEIYSWEELIAFTTTRAERNIASQVIYNKSGADIEINPEYLLDARRVATADFSFESDIYIYGDRVAIVSTKGTIAGVIIESKAIATTMLSIYQLAWVAALEQMHSPKLEIDRKKTGKTDNF